MLGLTTVFKEMILPEEYIDKQQQPKQKQKLSEKETVKEKEKEKEIVHTTKDDVLIALRAGKPIILPKRTSKKRTDKNFEYN